MPLSLKNVLWNRRSEPQLADGEQTLLTSTTLARARGIACPLMLTNRRVVWYETATAWPLKPRYGEIKLSDVVSVDEGNILDLIGGGALRLRLLNGKTKTVRFNGYNLSEWITAIRELIADEDVR